VDGGINFGDFGNAFEFGGKLGPLSPQGLAMSAPGGIEFEKPGLIGFIDGGFEVISIKYDNIFLGGSPVLVLLSENKTSECESDEQKCEFPHPFRFIIIYV
jgi:hypothetical protein